MPMKVVICNPLTQAAVQKYHHVCSYDFIKYIGLYGQSINHLVAMNSSFSRLISILIYTLNILRPIWWNSQTIQTNGVIITGHVIGIFVHTKVCLFIVSSSGKILFALGIHHISCSKNSISKLNTDKNIKQPYKTLFTTFFQFWYLYHHIMALLI